ncbi:hypothetical protein MBANPS3_012680, partial [Mucor bainieri]
MQKRQRDEQADAGASDDASQQKKQRASETSSVDTTKPEQLQATPKRQGLLDRAWLGLPARPNRSKPISLSKRRADNDPADTSANASVADTTRPEQLQASVA